MAQTYTFNSQIGIEIIKKMQDTRIALAENMKSAEQEKDLIIEEIGLKGFSEATATLNEVVDNMQSLSLRIRGMVGGGLSVVPKS